MCWRRRCAAVPRLLCTKDLDPQLLRLELRLLPGQRRRLGSPAASCRTQGGGDQGRGEDNAWKRISGFRMNRRQDYLWEKAVWHKVAEAEGRGQREASSLLEKASVSLLLPPWRREASGRTIKSIRTGRRQGSRSPDAPNWR